MDADEVATRPKAVDFIRVFGDFPVAKTHSKRLKYRALEC
jgi:hypothetical protein